MEHTDECSKEFPALVYRKRKTEYQLFGYANDFLARQIVLWRDGNECVEKEMDGANCRGGVQWGHVLNQHGHPAIIWNLLNSNAQCEGHNHMHGPQQKYEVYYRWFVQRWGEEKFDELQELGKRPALWAIELADNLKRLQSLWNNRPSLYTQEQLVELGYYD